MKKHPYPYLISKDQSAPVRCVLLILCFCCFQRAVGYAQPKTEILWDNFGVPHVYAPTDVDMYYAFGWAQMHNHANLLLHLYGEARGRAAEYWGEKYLDSDKKIHLFNLPEISRRHYLLQKGKNKARLDAFVRGINEYAKAHPENIEKQVKAVLPVGVTDIISHMVRVIYLEFIASAEIVNATTESAAGSNSFAIGPSKSASHKAMLAANPHLPWGDFFLFFEAHLTSPGFDAYGASLVGMPVLNIAFNHNLGWTHTVNTIDAADRYELTVKENGYLLDGKILPFHKKNSILKVLQQDSTMKTVNMEFLYSKHGPVVGRKDNKAFAIRIAGMSNAFFVSQYHDMAKARNLVEFEKAVSRLQIPMFNIIYADKKGNILYLFNGNVPKRHQGDWNFWSRSVDGSKSEYIWNSYHRYEELPRLINPRAGFVQNANDPPWTSSYPPILRPEDFPPYMSPQGASLRPQRAINLIKGDSSITFEELIGYKMNTGMEAADRFLDDLLEAVDQSQDAVAHQAAEILRKWDKRVNADSRGAVLFTRWFDKLNAGMFRIPWDSAHPVTTPDGLKDPAHAVWLLSQAAAETQKTYGSMEVAWGEVYHFRIGDKILPANGGPDKYGILRSMYFNRDRIVFQGDTYVAVTEFGDKVQSRVLLSYGNATQPGSKHHSDQLDALSRKELRPALLERNEILGHAEEKELLPALTPSR